MTRTLKPEDVIPEIRHSNYIEVKSEQSWGPRKIFDFELILIVHGTFYYERPEKEKIILTPKTVLCIPPGELHSFGIEKARGNKKNGIISCIHLELMKNKSFLKGDYKLKPMPPYVTEVSRDYVFHELFLNLSITHGKYSKYREKIEELSAKEIWLRLSEHWLSKPGDSISVRAKSMIAYLQENYMRNITRKDLSLEFKLTPEYINYVFKKETGSTPTEFIHSLRIKEGYRLIQEESLSIKEAAFQTGFCDEFYFSKIFKRIMKFPPSRICSTR